MEIKQSYIDRKFERRVLTLIVLFWIRNYTIAGTFFTSDINCVSNILITPVIENCHNYCLEFEDNNHIYIDTSKLDSDTIKSLWNPVDSIKIALRRKPFITGALDGRNSFVSADPVSIFGLRYGYDWGKVAAHTGIYSSMYIEFRDNDSTLYRFRYISSTFEYKLYRTYRYSFLCFGQIGIGATSVKSKLNPVGSPDLKPMIPLELGMYGSVRLLRYFGLAAGLGTRLALLKGGNRFSGPIYTFGITYFPSAMLEDGIKAMEKLNIKIPYGLE